MLSYLEKKGLCRFMLRILRWRFYLRLSRWLLNAVVGILREEQIWRWSQRLECCGHKLRTPKNSLGHQKLEEVKKDFTLEPTEGLLYLHFISLASRTTSDFFSVSYQKCFLKTTFKEKHYHIIGSISLNNRELL